VRLCALRELVPGMLLGKSLFREDGQLLLRAGYPLDDEVLRRLQETGRTAMYILEEGTEDIVPEEIISEEARSRAVAAFGETVQRVGEAAAFRKDIPPEKLHQVIARGAEFRDVVDVERVTAEVTSVVDEILDSSSQFLNQTLIKSRTGYNTEHSVDTTLITLLIGRHLLYSRRDLVELGMGAFLHDLGKLALPKLLTKPPSQYSEDEHFIMREHPVFGQQLLANSSDRFFMAQTSILHHHERQDGLGYPLGLSGCNKKPYLDGNDASKFIFPFAEIIAVADVYDNLISHHKGAPQTPEEALSDIARHARSAFNSEVVAILAKVIAVFPTGSMVRIAECSSRVLEGAEGAVMRPNADRPHAPLIVLLRNVRGTKITPKTIDLSAEPYVRLELIV
jgi:HD-GYP domain-containing protein (c-di-GMP phosphodiesterase class II)